MEENSIPKKILYMNLATTKLRGRPRNRWQCEVREDGGQVGGKGWKEGIYNIEAWKKLLRTARNHRILHMLMELNFSWPENTFRTSQFCVNLKQNKIK